MKTEKQLKSIRSNTFKMGTAMYEKFKESGNIEELRASVRSYNSTLQAIKYTVLYSKKK
jgi:hypothetical protein